MYLAMGNGINKSSCSVLDEIRNDLRPKLRVNVWWPNDKCAYGGSVLKFGKDSKNYDLVWIAYDDGEVKSYKLNNFLLTRLGIGKVTHACARL